MTHIFIIYLCIWANSVLPKLTYTASEERANNFLTWWYHYWFFSVIFIHSERKIEKKRKEPNGSKAARKIRSTFSHRDVANNVDLFKCIQHFSFIFSFPFHIFCSSSIFRSFCLSSETICEHAFDTFYLSYYPCLRIPFQNQ